MNFRDIEYNIRCKYIDTLDHFEFHTPSILRRKLVKVFLKSLIITIAICLIFKVAQYIFAILFLDGASSLYEYLMNSSSLNLIVNLVICIVIPLFMLAFAYHSYLYLQVTEITPEQELISLEMSRSFPKLKRILLDRKNNQGFISLMDYKALGIETIYEHLEFCKNKTLCDN